MKYIIERTSKSSKKLPCEEAYIDTYIRIDERTIDDPKKLNGMFDRNNWYKLGKNHRVEDGHIKRDFKIKAYFIDINSLEELNKLSNKYGELIISSSFDNENIPSIEIYDTYRE